jgi:branched-chain amino acid transport system ATP-binding protein
MLKEAPKLDQSFLKLDDVAASYGPIEVLRRVSLEVRRGEIVCLLGGNAAGKSTTLKTILGLLRPTDGSVALDHQRIDRLPTEDIVRRGIALVPESRRIFARMTVWENLAMGAYSRRGAPPGDFAEDLERVYTLFPRLEERAAQHGGTLSGGEQQMLAISRGLASSPRLLMLDEPSMGLAPAVADEIFDRIVAIHREAKLSVLLVEQRVAEALHFADRGYVLENGRVILEGDHETLKNDDRIRQAYLGM